MVNLESRISVPEGVLFRDVEGEAVILNTETGRYYGLNDVGTRVWALLAEHGRVEPAYRALLDEYDVTEERLKQDLLELLDKLASHGLLEVSEG